MGGAVSSGRDNAELIDNLKNSNYIRTPRVEAAFRAVDRGDFVPDTSRFQAYRDLAWKLGPLHLSAPCIYSEVMEALELNEGVTFLNVGSGTGYLSTMAGLLLGERGINHGIELHPQVLVYANDHLAEFMSTSSAMDEFDFCAPIFVQGNGLCLGSVRYDRVYCGAACPDEFTNYFKLLLNVDGILVMPLNDDLIQVRRLSETEWKKKSLLSVSFAPLQRPSAATPLATLSPPEFTISPSPLQELARGAIRRRARSLVLAAHPALREPPPRPKRLTSPPHPGCQHLNLPLSDESDTELNELHDIEDRASGAAEMNALLSLVLSMSRSRASGALRLPRYNSDRDSLYSDEEPPPDTGGGERGENAARHPDRQDTARRSDRRGTSRRASTSSQSSLTDEGDEMYTRRTRSSYSSDQPTSSEKTRRDEANKRESHGAKEDSKEGASTQNNDELPNHSKQREPRERKTASSGIMIVGNAATVTASEPAEMASEMEDIMPSEAADGAPATADERAVVEGWGTLDSGIGRAQSSGSDDSARLQRRRSWLKRLRSTRSSSSSWSSDSSGDAPRRNKAVRRRPRSPEHCRACCDAYGARRDAIALLMRAKVAALPLPPALRRYVNLDRPLDAE